MQTVAHHPQLQEWLRTATIPTNQYYFKSEPLRNNRSRPREVVTSIVTSNVFDVPDDFAFEAAELQGSTGTMREGEGEVAAGETPLIVTAHRGRGRGTTPLFCPEHEPVRSWEDLHTI